MMIFMNGINCRTGEVRDLKCQSFAKPYESSWFLSVDFDFLFGSWILETKSSDF